uniref:Uncharacterized protein n=1 Tax=Oryza rufipogon TaxID=4529 RepID=A0A0E0NEN7_ORYRU
MGIACVCVGRWWCARRREARPPLPRAVAALLVLGFVAGTEFWLFFPAIYGGGMDDLVPRGDCRVCKRPRPWRKLDRGKRILICPFVYNFFLKFNANNCKLGCGYSMQVGDISGKNELSVENS